MQVIHRIAAVALGAAAAGAGALAVAAPAAEAPAPEPVVQLDASIATGRLPIAPGTPLTLTIDARFSSRPAGGSFVLQKVDHLLGRGARFNPRLFPTCSAARLRAAHGRLSACPRGSRIGGGYAAGTAVAVGVSSRAALTLFNGPGGRSITMNALVLNPAYINETLSLPLVRLRGGGRYEWRLSGTIPEEFKTILGGPVAITRLHVTAGATRMVDGVRRGIFEVKRCPRGGSAIHLEYTFDQGRTAIADDTVAC